MSADAFDWEGYWRDAGDAEYDESGPSAGHVSDVLCEFVAGRPAGPVADVGCGPGAATFALAERFPDREVVGYDTAEAVLAENRERAADRGLDNVSFERATLPAFDPDREFAVVACHFTLLYVRDVERALSNLHDAVAPGGALVFNYGNRALRDFLRVAADDPHAHTDRPFVFDPEDYTARFGPLLEGDSVLSRERIDDAVGTWPRDVYTVVERPDVRWAWHHLPHVFVPNPD
ncbi:class I SAM-dependent methyltransferase [Halosegnis marinus]|uniref:Class I SAM-dependent methyltransferase n=1 Tax=Halosegnis marinus TaxID=3034023 RepID=A0ABD5ZNY8_9EURY|nr:class I SAM-dependent methyltransferase [Halosegnis sp. DT85]